jgi:dTDP-6-deoxy-L-talose 4-dehydrogenase (NAD+)
VKVLVTGATGFIGRHVIPRLLDRGHAVTALVRDDARARGFPWYGLVKQVVGDMHHFDESIVPDLGDHDVAIHLAWQGLPNYDALFHFEENLPANYRFLRSLVRSGVGHILVTGTCYEYGMQSGCLTEDSPTQPANPYALAKDTLRRFLEALRAQQEFTLQWARLFYLYGQGQSNVSLLAQLDRAIESGAARFDMSGGEQLRDYLPVEEVANRLAWLAEHPQYQGAVNICSGQPISVRRLVERYLEEKGATIGLNLGHYPYRAHEPMAFWGANTKVPFIGGSETA